MSLQDDSFSHVLLCCSLGISPAVLNTSADCDSERRDRAVGREGSLRGSVEVRSLWLGNMLCASSSQDWVDSVVTSRDSAP